MFTINFELEVLSRQQPFSLSKHLDIYSCHSMQLFRRANQSRILLESMNFIKGPFKASIKEDIKPFDPFTDNPYTFCVSLLHARVLQDLVE